MEDFVQKIFKLKNKIIHDGWLIFPPSKRYLIFRVEWFIRKEKYGFEMIYSKLEIEKTNIDFAELFVERANREITEYLRDV